MKKCLIDANAFSLIVNNKTPEKWWRIWKEIRMGQRELLLLEPVVSEIYYKNVPTFGKKEIKNKILGLKSFPGSREYSPDDNDSLRAGAIKVDHSPHNLSLVDCYILAVANKHKAMILTTDHGVRDVARKMRIDVSFVPFKK